MWGLLLNFGTWLIGFMFRGVVIKFLVAASIVYVVALLASFVFNSLANVDFIGLQNAISTLPDALLYFLTTFQFHVGVPMLIGAFLARFAIRRIPFIG